MRAIVRNVLLACLISTFAFFGAVGRKHTKEKMSAAQTVEVRKETLTCLSVAFLAWGLCIWRCSVINRRVNDEREYQRRFNEYMRASALNRHHY